MQGESGTAKLCSAAAELTFFLACRLMGLSKPSAYFLFAANISLSRLGMRTSEPSSAIASSVFVVRCYGMKKHKGAVPVLSATSA